MNKTKNCIPEKAFSYINAIIALSEKDGTESGADIKTLAIDLSNMLTKQMEAHGDYITDDSLEWHDLKKNPDDVLQDKERIVLEDRIVK